MVTRLRDKPIGITLGTIVKAVVVLLVLWLLYSLRSIVLIVLVSVVIAAAIEPAARWLGRHRIPRLPAVLGIYLITFGIIFTLLPFFVFPILVDLAELSATLSARIDGINLGGGDGVWGFLGTNLANYISFSDILSTLRDSLAGVQRTLASPISFIFGSFFSFVLIVVISFYLSVQSAGIDNFLRIVTPAGYESYILDLWRRSQHKIGLWMQGQLLLGLIVGVLVFLGLTILQVKHALVLAILAAIFELIPFFGPILSAVPAVLLGFSQSTSLGFIVIVFYLIIQQFENQLIYPLVVKKIVGVPALIVILALLAGGKLAGFLGIILAVPVATVIMELASDIEKKKAAVVTTI